MSVFNPNKGKYGPEKTPHFGHFSRSVIAIHSKKLYRELSESQVKKLHEKVCDEIFLVLLSRRILTFTDPGFYPRNCLVFPKHKKQP